MIEIQKLDKKFGDNVVLDKLSFTIGDNSIYGLLGPNGSGKTTTINILCGLLEADGGGISIQGNLSGEERKHFIGVVPQEISVYQDLTCRENLSFFARLYGLQGRVRMDRVNELIQLFNLSRYENTRVNRLSGGWQRRVNIAVAMAHSPKVLIMDEPTAGLDVEARHELWDIIKALKSNGVSILLTTHQLEEAERLCTKIGILKNGRIAAEGMLGELRKLVPAKQIAYIETEDEQLFYEKVKDMRWQYRSYGGGFNIFLKERDTIKGVVNKLNGIRLRSISLQEPVLEHIYLEVTGNINETNPSTNSK